MTGTTHPAPVVAAPVALRRWLPGLLGLALIWGSSFLFIKIGVLALPAAYVAFGRVASGAVVLVLLVLITRERWPRSLKLWGHNAFVGVVGIAAPFSLFAFGETHISSVLAGIWNATTPLFVLPMAVLVFRTELLSPRRVLGLALGLIGALVILGVWRGVGGVSLSGQLMCLGAAVCYGVAIPYTKRFIAPHPESGTVLSACQLLVATVVLAVASPILSGGGLDPAKVTWPVVGAVLALGVLGTGLAFVVNMRNIRLVGATTASMVTYIVPVFATLLGVTVLREPLEWFQPAGALVVLSGVAISQGLLSRRARTSPDILADPKPLCSTEAGSDSR